MRFPSQTRIPRRQAFLLLIAILIPCLVLVALASYMIEQDRELQRDVQRKQLAAQVKQDLLSLLDEISRQEIAKALSDGDREAPAPALQEAVAFTGALVEGRLRLPWEDQPEAQKFRELVNAVNFSPAIRKAESAELATHQYVSAVEDYRQAIRVASHPSQEAYARLGLARALEKAGHRRESLAEYGRLLATAPGLVDEYGVPFAFYAGPPLIEADMRKGIQEWILPAADRERRLPLTALYTARDLARKLKAPDVEERVVRAIRDNEWAEQLQRNSALVARLAASPDQPIWIPNGEAHGLVGVTPSLGARGRLVVAVRTDEVLSQLTTAQSPRVATPADPAGVALDESTFPGLKLILPETDPEGTSRRQILLAFAVVLALAFALLAGYLVQRDVRRSLRLAELRSQFVSSVTHELKTPLTAIRMFTETLQLDEEVDSHTRSEYLDTILHESERLSRLVDNVLDFGNIERGKKTYRFRTVRLDQVVEGAARTIQYPLERAGFALDVAIERDLPGVAADSDALQQAILNLLTNAMKYSGDSRQIHLALDRKNGHAQIHVADHGIGIPLVDQGRIFERFYRVGSVATRHIPGAGLGLTLATHIAKAHGGGINVDSRVGDGSTFTIWLPLPETDSKEHLRSSV